MLLVVIGFFPPLANCNVREGNQSEEGEGAEERKEMEEDEEEVEEVEKEEEDLVETRASGPLLFLASDSTGLWVCRTGIVDWAIQNLKMSLISYSFNI